jgi:hypothetical protein
MFQRGQGLDLAFVVIVLWIFSHRNFVAGKINKLGRMKMRKSEKALVFRRRKLGGRRKRLNRLRIF